MRDPKDWNKYIRLQRYENLAEMTLDSIKLYKEKKVFKWFAEDGETIKSITYNEFGEIMRDIFYGLHSLGYLKGDHIAICSETNKEWVYTDLACQASGIVIVAVYPSLKPKEIEYILKDSESKAIFVDNQKNLEKILSIENELPNLKYVFVIENFNNSLKKEKIISIDVLISKGRNSPQRNSTLFDDTVANIKEDDLASLIYTSGTTGIPKGVMLSHKNFISNAIASYAITSTMFKDYNLSNIQSITYMPFSHSFGRSSEEYSFLYAGATINFVGGKSQKLIKKAFKTFKPTLMLGVPYVYQKLFKTILSTVKTEYPPPIQELFFDAMKTGRKYYELLIEGKEVPKEMEKKFKSSRRLLGRIKKELGGKLMGFISGSASISPELILFFLSAGFDIAEGYGLTEATPTTHVMRTEHNSDFRPDFNRKIAPYQKIGMCGPPIEFPGNPYENVQHKLSEEGELLIKGPNVMLGYWKKPKLTAATVDKDGWLHTGDLAEIDEDGYVKIVGRAKLIIKLMTGKMISPILVENMITPASNIVAQIILVGDDSRKFLTAIVVPYQFQLRKLADEKGIEYNGSWRDLIQNKEILNAIKEDVYKHTTEVTEFSRPKRFAISCKHFSEAEGYYTPSMKFKRNKIFTDFNHIIDKMYEINGDFIIMEDRLTDWYDMSILT